MAGPNPASLRSVRPLTLGKRSAPPVTNPETERMEAKMEPDSQQTGELAAPTDRALVVADWSLDPAGVVAALQARYARHGSQFALLVPASLHGIAWAGDPKASRPCAERRLGELRLLSERSGVSVGMARVGDPETVPAVLEALEDWPAEQILLFGRRRRSPFPRALSLARRIERSASIPVDWITHTAMAMPAGRRPHAALRCVPNPTAAA